ncbi:Zn-ribbon domain-containing OB-fold protein [uncultured Williamsia sp.]|uniref:Zn-ribbon domain-containing OB-fold protein n=1 Tax=uncultured Williamsia sp. TaxID=259311 RepID=UPI00260C4BD2|nr:Zn-ribbon domain-containing OB-fold protein [uncultured Williamsia sp.]
MGTRLAPTISPDTQFFWDGLRDHTILIQQCSDCGTRRFPPRPMCFSCQSLKWETVTAAGTGTVHSFVMPQYPPLPFFEYPYIVALIDLDEGVRLVSNLTDVAPDDVHIGMPVTAYFTTFDTLDKEELVLHQFRPTAAAVGD